MPLPRIVGVAVGGFEAGSRKGLLPRLAFLRQEVRAQPIGQRAERGLTARAVELDDRSTPQPDRRMSSASIANCGCRTGPSARNVSTPPRTPVDRRAKPLRCLAACEGGSQIAGSLVQVTPQRLRRDEPPVEQRRQSLTKTPFPQLREHQRDVLVVARDRPADAERLVQRFADETRHLGVVRELESRDRRRPRAGIHAAATGRRRR